MNQLGGNAEERHGTGELWRTGTVYCGPNWLKNDHIRPAHQTISKQAFANYDIHKMESNNDKKCIEFIRVDSRRINIKWCVWRVRLDLYSPASFALKFILASLASEIGFILASPIFHSPWRVGECLCCTLEWILLVHFYCIGFNGYYLYTYWNWNWFK